MKKLKFIGLGLVLYLIASLFAVLSGTTVFAANASGKDISSYDVESVTRQIFGDVKIKSSEYLYNFDGSADFIYVDFEDYGYAVYFKDTLELLEYSGYGSLPYPNTQAARYYGGPSNYFQKSGERFSNVLTGETTLLTASDAQSFSRGIREAFSDGQRAIDENDVINAEIESETFGKSSSGTAPDINTDSLIWADPPGTAGTKYINNHQYFTTVPGHGHNVHGTCGSVAAQLVLSYHNYHLDRRIIAPGHLNGDWNTATNNGNIFDPENYANPEQNPNASANPTSMTSQTLGSRSGAWGWVGSNWRYTIDPDGFYWHVINNIEAGAFNCVCTATTTAIVVAGGTATVTVTVVVTQPDGTTTTTTNTTTRPATPGETNSTNTSTTHTHGGATLNQVRDGMRNILTARGVAANVDSHTPFLNIGSIGSTGIKSQINAGRPVIILMQESLGGTNHYVVGYGYQDYTYPGTSNTYSGYIVHFGWTGETRIWVNESWCKSYISMQVTSHAQTNHTHNYTYVNNSQGEIRCGICGHRDTVFTTSVSGNNCTITGVKPNMTLTGNLVIPATINGRTVVGIGNNAFANQSLTKIIIPNTVATIGSSIFLNCPNSINVVFSNGSQLTSVGSDSLFTENNTGGSTCVLTGVKPNITFTISGILIIPALLNGRTVTQIASYAFEGYLFTEVHIPSSVTHIGDNAFEGCVNLCAVQFASGSQLTNIGARAFRNCVNLTGIALPYTVTTLGNRAFQFCWSLASVTLGYITSIGDYTFDTCGLLTSINIPFSVASIGEGAFIRCAGLVSIIIPRGVTSIGSYAFAGCSSLAYLSLPFVGHTYGGVTNTHFGYIFGAAGYAGNGAAVPPSLKTVEITRELKIDNSAFEGCADLKNIILPYYLLSIGPGAFRNCSSLTEITVPYFVHTLGNRAFQFCGSLTSVTILGGITSIGDYTFGGCTSLKNVDMPNGVASFGDGVFLMCDSLKNITLPGGLTSMGHSTFAHCGNLESVTIPSGVTAMGTDTFLNCAKLTVYTAAAAKPGGWHANWNNSARPVVWGCTLSPSNRVERFTKSGAMSGYNNPYCAGNTFDGWYLNASFTGARYAALASAPNGTLYAKWV